MAGDRLLIEFDLTGLGETILTRLWGLVVDAAVDQLADEVSIEGLISAADVPPEVDEAQRRLLAGEPVDRRPKRWHWRRPNADVLASIKALGPWVLGLNLYRDGSSIAGVSAHHDSVNLITSETQ